MTPGVGQRFIAAFDGHGGTLAHDPAAPVASWSPWMAPASGQRFIAATAGVGDTSAGSFAGGAIAPWRTGPTLLATPSTHLA